MSADENRSREEGGGRVAHKRSSNVFRSLGRNSDITSASDLRLLATHVLETHRDNKTDFVYVIQVAYQDSKWEIKKRYCDLLFFSERMKEANIKCGAKGFPSKIAGKATFDHATAKISELNGWFAGLVGSSESRFAPGSQEEQQLFNFIELFLHQPPAIKDRMGRSFPDRVLHSGYLRKLGGNKAGAVGNWKRRFVVLQKDLMYFEDEDTFRNGGLPKGVIKLNAFCVEKKPDGLLNEFVVHSMPYPLVCRAASPEDLEGWVAALTQVGEGGRSNSTRCTGTSTDRRTPPPEEEEEEIQWA